MFRNFPSSNGRKIARIARNSTIFGPNESSRRDLFLEKFSNERNVRKVFEKIENFSKKFSKNFSNFFSENFGVTSKKQIDKMTCKKYHPSYSNFINHKHPFFTFYEKMDRWAETGWCIRCRNIHFKSRNLSMGYIIWLRPPRFVTYIIKSFWDIDID